MTPEEITELARGYGMLAAPGQNPPDADAVEEFARAIIAQARAEMRAEMVPVATLHDDGHYTFHGAKPESYDRAGWRMDVYAAAPDSIIPSIKEGS